MPSGVASALPALLATQTYVSDSVQSGIGANAEIGPRHVVGHRGGNHNHGDTQLLLLLPGLGEFQQPQVGLLDKCVQLWGQRGCTGASKGHREGQPLARNKRTNGTTLCRSEILLWARVYLKFLHWKVIRGLRLVEYKKLRSTVNM